MVTIVKGNRHTETEVRLSRLSLTVTLGSRSGEGSVYPVTSTLTDAYPYETYRFQTHCKNPRGLGFFSLCTSGPRRYL